MPALLTSLILYYQITLVLKTAFLYLSSTATHKGKDTIGLTHTPLGQLIYHQLPVPENIRQRSLVIMAQCEQGIYLGVRSAFLYLANGFGCNAGGLAHSLKALTLLLAQIIKPFAHKVKIKIALGLYLVLQYPIHPLPFGPGLCP